MVVKHVVYHRSVNLPHFPTLTNDRLEYNNKDPPAQRRLGGEEGKKEGVLHTYISTYILCTYGVQRSDNAVCSHSCAHKKAGDLERGSLFMIANSQM